jgi:hypothetical protein
VHKHTDTGCLHRHTKWKDARTYTRSYMHTQTNAHKTKVALHCRRLGREHVSSQSQTNRAWVQAGNGGSATCGTGHKPPSPTPGLHNACKPRRANSSGGMRGGGGAGRGTGHPPFGGSSPSPRALPSLTLRCMRRADPGGSPRPLPPPLLPQPPGSEGDARPGVVGSTGDAADTTRMQHRSRKHERHTDVSKTRRRRPT